MDFQLSTVHSLEIFSGFVIVWVELAVADGIMGVLEDSGECTAEMEWRGLLEIGIEEKVGFEECEKDCWV